MKCVWSEWSVCEVGDVCGVWMWRSGREGGMHTITLVDLFCKQAPENNI